MTTTNPVILRLLLALPLLVCAVEPASAIEHAPASQAVAPLEPSRVVIDKVTTHALAGDWRQVFELTKGVDLTHPSPVLKLVRGHACLALNHNNEATLLFFGTRDPQQLQAYQEWASGNLAKNPDQPYAHFFTGDAAARLGKWDEALREFDAAIRFKQDFALAYNARGAANALRKDIGAANNDFSRASEIDSRLADTYNSAGYLWVQRKEGGAKGATSAFSKAIENTPDFSLALHGRGCVQLASGHAKVAYDDLRRADTQAPALSPILLENEIRYVAATTGIPHSDLFTALSAPGSPFKEREQVLQDLNRSASVRERLKGTPLEPLAAFFGENDAVKRVADYNARTNSKMDLPTRQQEQLVSAASRGKVWDSDGGGARRFIANADSVGSTIAGAAGITAGITSAPVVGNGAPLLGFGVTKVSEHANKAIGNWLNQGTSRDLQRHERVLKDYHDALPRSADSESGRSTVTSKISEKGGALADPPVLNGKWPFVAIYGLGYGIVE